MQDQRSLQRWKVTNIYYSPVLIANIEVHVSDDIVFRDVFEKYCIQEKLQNQTDFFFSIFSPYKIKQFDFQSRPPFLTKLGVLVRKQTETENKYERTEVPSLKRTNEKNISILLKLAIVNEV